MRDIVRASKFVVAHEGASSNEANRALALLIAEVRADERERCAKEIEEYGEKCIEQYGGTSGEMVTFTLCATHIRQLGTEMN